MPIPLELKTPTFSINGRGIDGIIEGLRNSLSEMTDDEINYLVNVVLPLALDISEEFEKRNKGKIND